ncbi:hypothetical protein [Sagittula sp. SSi028]|uniref:hypothetical protein n=1 Tax=Sagittula sp. SSi028 TaxID=3400636 RepID=UPI003AF7CEF6
MTQIDELQARITRALDRIGQGLEAYEPGPGGAELSALQDKLAESERALAATTEAAAQQADKAEEALEAARLAQESAVADAVEAAKADQEAAIAAAVEEAVAREAEMHEAALAAVRAEAEAAIAAAAEAAQANDSGVSSADWARVEDELRLVREALEDEKLANAQLTERMRHLKERMVSGGAAAAAEAAPAAEAPDRDTLQALDAEVQRLRAANAQLAESNTALREANAMGVGDTQLINKALAAELEAMRASRALEIAEAEALVATLEPLLAEAADATEETSA